MRRTLSASFQWTRSFCSSPSTHTTQVLQFFSHMEKGLQPMLPLNKGMKCEIVHNPHILSMQVDIGEQGIYTLSSSPDDSTLSMMSPLSGTVHRYTFDKRNEQWTSLKDGHLLTELFVREIVLKCKGYPYL